MTLVECGEPCGGATAKMVVDEAAPPPKTDGSKDPLASGETGGHFVRKQAYFNVENHVSTSLRA